MGTRACDFKPFYPAAKVTVIGAISLSKALAVMTLNDSRDGAAFSVFIERCLCPQLWKGAVVVMGNLPAHQVAPIVPMIEAVGARVIYPPTLQILIPLNSGGHNLNLFCELFLLRPRND